MEPTTSEDALTAIRRLYAKLEEVGLPPGPRTNQHIIRFHNEKAEALDRISSMWAAIALVVDGSDSLSGLLELSAQGLSEELRSSANAHRRVAWNHEADR